MVTFRDNIRLYKESDLSSVFFRVYLTTGMESYKEEDFLDLVIKQCDRFGVKLSPHSFLAKCFCLMIYSCKNEKSDVEVNMTEVPIVYGPLSSFIDRDDGVDLELSCLSQMSVTVIFFPNITISGFSHGVSFIIWSNNEPVCSGTRNFGMSNALPSKGRISCRSENKLGVLIVRNHCCTIATVRI